MPEPKDVERCEYMHVHEAIVNQVNQNMPDEEVLYDLAELFKIFGDSTRIKILYVLFESEMCVCDIAQLLGMTQSAISHQLRSLKQSRLVKARREGKTVFYSLADGHVCMFFSSGICRCAPRSLHADSMVSNTDGSCTGYSTTSPPFLMMPAFSNAIFA